MKKLFLFVLILTFSACSSSDNTQNQESEVDSSVASSEESSEEIPQENPQDDAQNADFLPGNWKVTAYDLEAGKVEQIKKEGNDIAFSMEASQHTTSLYEFAKDGTYILRNQTGEFGDENKIVDSGKWALSDDLKQLTLSGRPASQEDIVMEIKENSPQKLILAWKSKLFANGEITMTLESINE